MSYLIDTPVVSELVRARPDAGVTSWIESKDERTLFLSVVTVGEIDKGIAKLQRSSKRAQLARWLDEHLLVRFGPRLLPVSMGVARRWGRMLGEADRRGRPLPVVDALIAATAAAHELTVATRNVRHFEQAGVQVVDPWTARG